MSARRQEHTTTQHCARIHKYINPTRATTRDLHTAIRTHACEYNAGARNLHSAVHPGADPRLIYLCVAGRRRVRVGVRVGAFGGRARAALRARLKRQRLLSLRPPLAAAGRRRRRVSTFI